MNLRRPRERRPREEVSKIALGSDTTISTSTKLSTKKYFANIRSTVPLKLIPIPNVKKLSLKLSTNLSIEDDSDLAFDLRHKKKELAEKRQRLRDLEVLNHEIYKRQTKLNSISDNNKISISLWIDDELIDDLSSCHENVVCSNSNNSSTIDSIEIGFRGSELSPKGAKDNNLLFGFLDSFFGDKLKTRMVNDGLFLKRGVLKLKIRESRNANDFKLPKRLKISESFHQKLKNEASKRSKRLNLVWGYSFPNELLINSFTPFEDSDQFLKFLSKQKV